MSQTRLLSSGAEACVLTFENVSWTAPNGRKVLGGVNGVVLGGTVTAIMGASGAGKTTLLQTLGGQVFPPRPCC
jgi:ATP-binding cassette subfamily G (WHITE) protein 2 (SNQ2)